MLGTGSDTKKATNDNVRTQKRKFHTLVKFAILLLHKQLVGEKKRDKGF
jgi:hypothetical protein